jgi:RNA polymerase sigma-54 factor
MALSAKLELRQSQSLVITPQLQQAIKLLQLSNLELEAYVERELEQNPLLERDERAPDAPSGVDAPGAADAASGAGETAPDGQASASQDLEPGGIEFSDASSASLIGDPQGELDTDFGNVFPEADSLAGLSADSGWSSLRVTNGAGADMDRTVDTLASTSDSLRDHLQEQLHLTVADPVRRLIGEHLIDMVDEAGYLRGDLADAAEQLGAPLAWTEETLAILQTFDPVGVCARNLKECLALQLKEKNRFDPLIERFLEHIELLASHDLPRLKRLCGADDEDLEDMIAEVRTLNPKPGLQFGSEMADPVTPDVFVRPRADGGWLVEVNTETLPKLLINRAYYTTVAKGAKSPQEKSYLSSCLGSANWLMRSLDQRIKTILKVAEEIVKQQDAFLHYGVRCLKPLSLRDVAETIDMHESTVSRVTSNKYMATPRGLFELKYFFTSSIPAAGIGDAHSSEAVRHRIKELIDNEPPKNVLSDDKIVELLRRQGVDIARRTVAKYRDLMRIPSSVQRRREKMARIRKGLASITGKNGA